MCEWHVTQLQTWIQRKVGLFRDHLILSPSPKQDHPYQNYFTQIQSNPGVTKHLVLQGQMSVAGLSTGWVNSMCPATFPLPPHPINIQHPATTAPTAVPMLHRAPVPNQLRQVPNAAQVSGQLEQEGCAACIRSPAHKTSPTHSVQSMGQLQMKGQHRGLIDRALQARSSLQDIFDTPSVIY